MEIGRPRIYTNSKYISRRGKEGLPSLRISSFLLKKNVAKWEKRKIPVMFTDERRRLIQLLQDGFNDENTLRRMIVLLREMLSYLCLG